MVSEEVNTYRIVSRETFVRRAIKTRRKAGEGGYFRIFELFFLILVIMPP